ncbi:MAG: prolyl oligopeptidase family serine peptidase [Ilumatobacteraceae bacterium]
MEHRAAGTWPSPVTAVSLVGGAVGISEVVVDGDDVWWAEQRPEENGRTALIRWRAGAATEVTPPGANVRTSVHEYGGGAWWAALGSAYYVEFADQRLRRIAPDGDPVLLTPEPETPRGLRYADGRVTPDGEWYMCVHERHGGRGEAVNEIVAVATDGSFRVNVLASGADFYASPRISPDGGRLVWVQWMHPNMPWDSTELWIADLADGETSAPRMLVGNGDEALQQPDWTDAGELLVATDRSDWWTVHRVDPTSGDLTHEAGGDSDVVQPHWGFGGSRFIDGVHVVNGPLGDRLSSGVDLPYTSISSLRSAGDSLVFVGASFSTEAEVVRLTGGDVEILRPARDLGLDPAFLPDPEFVTFPTTDGQFAHGLFYAPAHPDFEVSADEHPPLVVFIHGGPTSSAVREYSARLGHRFWTSRGFAVVDVDYRGSTGYGRSYRKLLRGQWCRIDVDDAVAAAVFLADRGHVDAHRLLIRGGSAGGTTTLLALARSDVFAAGTNLFGVTDLIALMSDDHKFESQYSVSLVAPWPEGAEVYAERSPINHAHEISSPLLVLQGADDTVVPPAHSEQIVAALIAHDLPVGYIEFVGEGHGFRGADAIVRAIEAELWFYGRILGFEPADEIEPVAISGIAAG